MTEIAIPTEMQQTLRVSRPHAKTRATRRKHLSSSYAHSPIVENCVNIYHRKHLFLPLPPTIREKKEHKFCHIRRQSRIAVIEARGFSRKYESVKTPSAKFGTRTHGHSKDLQGQKQERRERDREREIKREKRHRKTKR